LRSRSVFFRTTPEELIHGGDSPLLARTQKSFRELGPRAKPEGSASLRIAFDIKENLNPIAFNTHPDSASGLQKERRPSCEE
jgi:hypothetical protein